MKRKTMMLLGLVLATGLIAAGCGGDDDDDGGDGGESLGKAEFVEQGNQICDEGNQEIETAADETFGDVQPTPEEQDAFVTETLVPNVQGQIDSIRDLGPPEADEDEINGILEDAEAALSDIEEDPSLAQGGVDPFEDVNRRLSEYGLTSCG